MLLSIFTRMALAGQKGSISGIIIDSETKNVLSNVILELNDIARIKHITNTDSSGKYSINNIPNGSYIINIKKPGYQPKTECKNMRSGLDIRCNFSLLQGSNIYIKDICKGLKNKDNCTITGIIKDCYTLKPIQNALIIIHNTNDSIKTNNVGKFLRTGVSPGKVKLSIKAPGYEHLVFDIDISDILEVDIELKKDPEEIVRTNNIIHVKAVR